MKTSFGVRVSRGGLDNFIDINIFVLKYYLIFFLHILHFFEYFKIKIYTNVRPQKVNSGVSINDTLKFWTLLCRVLM